MTNENAHAQVFQDFPTNFVNFTTFFLNNNESYSNITQLPCFFKILRLEVYKDGKLGQEIKSIS